MPQVAIVSAPSFTTTLFAAPTCRMMYHRPLFCSAVSRVTLRVARTRINPQNVVHASPARERGGQGEARCRAPGKSRARVRRKGTRVRRDTNHPRPERFRRVKGLGDRFWGGWDRARVGPGLGCSLAAERFVVRHRVPQSALNARRMKQVMFTSGPLVAPAASEEAQASPGRAQESPRSLPRP